jgi:two-component system, LytTR family, sensor kinase
VIHASITSSGGQRKKTGYWIFQGIFALVIVSTSAVGIWSIPSSESPITLTPEQKIDLAKLLVHVYQQAQVELGVEVLGIFLLTHLLQAFSRKHGWLEKSPTQLAARAVGSSVLLGGVLATVVLVVSGVFFGDSFTDLKDQPLLTFVDRWQSGVLKIAAWCALFYGFQTYARISWLQLESVRQEVAAKDARLEAITAQLNPHFLFNALNTVRGLIDEDPQHARDAVTALSHVLRASLQSTRSHLIPLVEELAVVEAHLSLEQARHGERLTITREVAADTMGARVPPLLIQTLVENSVKHGIAARPGPGFVHYAAWREARGLMVEICNGGTLSRLENSGLGLIHTRERLQLLFGPTASLDLSTGKKGVIARVCIPQLDHEFTQS